MGIITVFLKDIPEEYHLDSFEINADLSDLAKQRPTNAMRIIFLSEYLRIKEENARKRANEHQVVIYRGAQWKGYFETARNIVLRGIGLQAERKLHVRGRYDLMEREPAQTLETKLMRDLEQEKTEGTTYTFAKRNHPRTGKPHATGVIQIGMWPCLTCDMQYLARDVMIGLITEEKIRSIYDSSISVVYSKKPFGQNAHLSFHHREDGHLNITVRDAPQQQLIKLIADSADPYVFMDQFENLIPSKPESDPAFFSACFITHGSRTYY